MIVGDIDMLGDEPAAGSIAFARPKSRTLTVPSGRSLMLAGLRSRWMIPCSCAASSASAICLRDRQRLVERNRPLGDPIRQRRPLDQLQHQRRDAVGLLQAVDLRDVRVVERGEDFGFALEAGQPLGIRRHRRGQDLDRDRSLQVRVGRAIDLAHAAHAEQGDDVVRAEPRARGKCHRLLRRHAGLQLFGPVEDDVDLGRGSLLPFSDRCLLEQEEPLTIARHVVMAPGAERGSIQPFDHQLGEPQT